LVNIDNVSGISMFEAIKEEYITTFFFMTISAYSYQFTILDDIHGYKYHVQLIITIVEIKLKTALRTVTSYSNGHI